MRVAKEWHKLPSELGICGPDDNLTFMIAHMRAETKMLGWEQQEVERETKKRHAKDRS